MTAPVTNGRLFVVATPIGNLEDVTLRALRVLKEVDAILAEDTRHTRKLLEKYGVRTQLRAFHAHSPEHVMRRIAEELEAGARYALVTDAGTPLVSDPGAELAVECARRGVAIESVPGPSAVTTALLVAGIPCATFVFVGFLPRSGSKRRDAIARIGKGPDAAVLFEAPTRVGTTLADLRDAIGADRPAAVCRELTKLHEEVARGTLGDLAGRFEEGARGEVTIVIGGNSTGNEVVSSDAEIDARIDALAAEGAGSSEIAKTIAHETSLSRREAYARVLGRLRFNTGEDE